MDLVAAVVIGGTSMKGGSANSLGTLFGCLVVGLVGNGLNLLGIDSNWRMVSKGAMIVFAIILDSLTTKLYTKLGRAQR